MLTAYNNGLDYFANNEDAIWFSPALIKLSNDLREIASLVSIQYSIFFLMSLLISSPVHTLPTRLLKTLRINQCIFSINFTYLFSCFCMLTIGGCQLERRGEFAASRLTAEPDPRLDHHGKRPHSHQQPDVQETVYFCGHECFVQNLFFVEYPVVMWKVDQCGGRA